MLTNTQLYVAVGVPFFTILVVWLGTTLSNNRASKSLVKSIDDLATALRAEMRMGFEAVDKRLSRLESTVDRIDNEIRVNHEHRLTVLEQRMLTKIS